MTAASRGLRSAAALAACLLLACGPVHAQSSARAPQLCPLSDEQTQKSIDAFAKLTPTYHHPRCERCHGALDVFAENTPHGGGQQGDETGCDTCHTQVPGGEKWQLPIRDHFFVNKDAKTLCKQMRQAEGTAGEFMNHLSTDNLIKVAFLGTRALSPHDLEEEHLAVEPPPVSHSGFLRMAQTWIDAMGGDFKGEDSCGCEPQHYAVRISYKSTTRMAFVNSSETMGPVDIPIKFHDDGTYEGEQTVYFNGNSLAFICTATSTGSMNLKVSGDVSGVILNEVMSLKIQNTTVMRDGVVKAICPSYGKTMSMEPGEKASLEKDDIPAEVGAKMHFEPSAGVPGMTTTIDAEIVQIGR